MQRKNIRKSKAGAGARTAAGAGAAAAAAAEQPQQMQQPVPGCWVNLSDLLWSATQPHGADRDGYDTSETGVKFAAAVYTVLSRLAVADELSAAGFNVLLLQLRLLYLLGDSAAPMLVLVALLLWVVCL
jgi:hypothetical protein